MLAAIGLDAVLRRSERRRAARWGLGAFGAIAVLLGLIWLFGRGSLPPHEAHVRADSFVWPVVSTVVGLAAFGTLVVIDRRPTGKEWSRKGLRRLTLGAAGVLLVCQTVFLVVLDAPLPSSSSTPYQPTPGVTALQREVGSSLVGLGDASPEFGGFDLGIAADANVSFGIHEFAEYDPIAPLTYFTVWPKTNRTSAGVPAFWVFDPDIPSAVVARRYGISYVLERLGAAGPTGGVFVARVGNEELYRIPGASTATLVPATPTGAWPSIDAPGTAVPVVRPGPSQLRIVTNSSSPQVLRLRLASFPGWHATIDGRPLPLAHLSLHDVPGAHPGGETRHRAALLAQPIHRRSCHRRPGRGRTGDRLPCRLAT